MTKIPRLYNAVVKYYHRIIYATGKHCIFAINQYKGKFYFIIYFKNAVVFIASSTAGSSCCLVLCLFIFLLSNNRILHCFAILSHFIFVINKQKVKRHYIDDLKKNIYCLSCRVPLVQLSCTRYCYLILTQCQNICTVFISDYLE